MGSAFLLNDTKHSGYVRDRGQPLLYCSDRLWHLTGYKASSDRDILIFIMMDLRQIRQKEISSYFIFTSRKINPVYTWNHNKGDVTLY